MKPGLACIAAVVLATACAKDPTRPRPVGVLFIPTIDSHQVWSHDGTMIAFRRSYDSSDGPAGVYVISRWGGKPRFLAPGYIFWPVDLRFSPDDHTLVMVDDQSRLTFVDVATGAVSYASIRSGVRYPDWSPDGRTIAYLRLGFPAESTGIRLYEPDTGRDWQLPHDGAVVFGRFPRWSPDGSQIVFIGGDSSTTNISTIRPDGTGLRMLLRSDELVFFEHLQWFRRPSTGIEGLVFQQQVPRETGPAWFMLSDGTGLRRFERHLLPWDTFSPDGEEVVLNAADSVDSLVVLFIERIEDVSRATRRQLTSWDPPVATGTVLGTTR